MTDKQYERAQKIRADISELEFLRKETKKAIHISINLSSLEMLRKPFEKMVGEEIDKLKAEYESL